MEPKLALGAAFVTTLMLLAGASAVFAYDSAAKPVRTDQSEFARYAGTAMGIFTAIKSEVVDTLGTLGADNQLFADATAHTMWSMTKLKASVTGQLDASGTFAEYTADIMKNMTSIKADVTGTLAASDSFSQATADIMTNMMNIKSEVVSILWDATI